MRLEKSREADADAESILRCISEDSEQYDRDEMSCEKDLTSNILTLSCSCRGHKSRI